MTRRRRRITCPRTLGPDGTPVRAANHDQRRFLRWVNEEHVARLNRTLFGARLNTDTGEWGRAQHRVGSCGTPLAGRVAWGRTRGLANPDWQPDPSHEPSAQITGLETCGSANVCLRCAGRIRAQRALEVETILRAHLEAGGGAVLLTTTFSHNAGEGIEVVIDDSMDCWRAFTKMAVWTGMERDGFIRSTELTFGTAGVHPHHHVCILLPTPPTDTELESLTRRLTGAWTYQAEKIGRRVDPDAGVTVVPIRDAEGLGAYVSKISLEMTRSDKKLAGWSNRSHFEVALDAACGPNQTADRMLWREFVRVMARHRFMSMSHGLLERFGLVVETDDEIVAKVLPMEATVLVDPEVHRAVAAAKAIPGIRSALERNAPVEVIVDLVEHWTGRQVTVGLRDGGDRVPTLGFGAAQGLPSIPVADEPQDLRELQKLVRDWGRSAREELVAVASRRRAVVVRSVQSKLGVEWSVREGGM